MQKFVATHLAIASALVFLPINQVASAASSAPATEAGKMTTLERVKATEKGQLKNPITAVTPDIIAEGKQLYQAKTCGACHGANGSGIHGPSLINDAWIYGSDDDTLFRLVALGSEGIQAIGYTRGENEKHAGPMPAFGATLPDEQELWKILAYIRSLRPDGPKNGP